MLDDVFSGLDAISEDRIFSRLLGRSGLLRRLGTTVILVTHAAHAYPTLTTSSHSVLAAQSQSKVNLDILSWKMDMLLDLPHDM